MRLEHLDSLHAVLSDMMAESPSTVPNKTELMSIYGRVSCQAPARESRSGFGEIHGSLKVIGPMLAKFNLPAAAPGRSN